MVPIIGIILISRQMEPTLGFLAPIVYIAGWVHANSILSRGDPKLWNLAGVQLIANKQLQEAKQSFDRALAAGNDESLIKQIKQNQTLVERKLKSR